LMLCHRLKTLSALVIGAVHSEPKMTGPRLFFSVLPATKSQVKEREEFQKQFEEDVRTGKLKPTF